MIRSLLYIPGSIERFIAKAHLRGADAIIIDLEDGVAENEKRRARERLTDTVPRAGQSGALVFVRINHTPDRLLVDAQAACRAGAYGLYVPKVSCVSTLESLDNVLHPIEVALGRAPMVFVPLVEDAAGVLNAAAIANNPRVLAIGLGAEDLATSMGGEPLPEVLRIPKILVHLAAKAASKLSFGLFRTVADYQDVEAIQAAISEARSFGFDGATCIHPSIVPFLNKGFTPTQEEVEAARRLIAAARAQHEAGVGAFIFEGKFVDAPILERARMLVARSQSI